MHMFACPWLQQVRSGRAMQLVDGGRLWQPYLPLQASAPGVPSVIRTDLRVRPHDDAVSIL